VPITPEEINASKLPVSVRGYQREATEELLKRVAWDYRQVARAQKTAAEEAEQLRQRVEELEAEAESQRELFAREQIDRRAGLERELKERSQELEAEVEQLRSRLVEHEHREELTRVVLANAQRSARDLREAAKAESEALLKAARRRAAEIEAEARAALTHSSSEIGRLQQLENDLKAQLRRTLESLLDGDAPAAAPAPDQQAPLPVD